MTATTVHPVDERLPAGRLTALGLQHVLVMYAGAVAVPLIVGRALKLTPEQVALLISAGLFCCGIVTLIQSLGIGRFVGIRLPVMMGVTGVKSRWVCVAAGVIMIVLSLLPKMAALVESVPTFVLGGAGLVMFGMVAATGIRILGGVDYKNNRNNLFIVAVSIGIGMIPLIAPNFKQWMPHGLHPLIESGILLASMTAFGLNLFFNGAGGDATAEIAAAKQADAH